MGDFFISLLSVFMGAWIAFLSRIWQKKMHDDTNNRAYLTYVASNLTALIGNLYGRKKVLLPKKEEAAKFKMLLKEQPNLKSFSDIGELTKRIHFEKLKPINIEKLSFLAIHNPNVIVFIAELNNALESINLTIEETNSHIHSIFEKYDYAESASLNRKELEMLISYANILLSGVDASIYFSDTLHKVLIKFGKERWEKDFIIKSMKLCPSVEHLRPKAVGNWEIKDLETIHNLKSNFWSSLWLTIKKAPSYFLPPPEFRKWLRKKNK